MAQIIITAALTGGIHTPTMSPYLPITPQQIADEAVRVYEAGAAVAHIHVRNPENGHPSPGTATYLELFREVVTKVKSRCGIVLCLTTGGGVGMTTEQRASVVSHLRPELASLNAGSMNFSVFPMADPIEVFEHPWEKPFLQGTEDFIFPNTFKTLREFSEIFSKNETKPELEIYDPGMINNVAYLLQKGYIKRPIYLQFVLGILGGLPASSGNLLFLYNSAREALGDFVWSVAAAGRHQIPMCTISLINGGNARVGMEDSLYAGKSVLARSSADQVEKILRIARELSLEPASSDEARQMLGLKGPDKVNW